MARPTDYSDDILKKAREYLSTYEKQGKAVPSVAGLALYLGVHRDTIYDWSSQEDKQEFSDIVKQCLAKQEETLITNGLKGEFNASITKLLLTKHGYSDKQEIDQNLTGEVQFVNGVPRPD